LLNLRTQIYNFARLFSNGNTHVVSRQEIQMAP